VDIIKLRPAEPVRTRFFEFNRGESELHRNAFSLPRFVQQDHQIIERSHALRFQVYCLEEGFLPPERYPNGLESDEYDQTDRTLHYLSWHAQTQQDAGTARLICSSDMGFPMLEHCPVDPPYAFINDAQHPMRLTCAEVSRVSVAASFRRRAGDTRLGGPPREVADDAAAHEPPKPGSFPPKAGPEIVAGLYKCIYQDAKRAGVTHFLVAMEPGLRVLLRRMCMPFSKIGPEIDYYGPVAPYILAVEDLECDLLRRRPEVLDWWLYDLEEPFHPDLRALEHALSLDVPR
jgi:N-acyl amino acid synthase of PEP-CTERM/exosortase system